MPWSRPAHRSTESWLGSKPALGTWHLAKALFALSVIIKTDAHWWLVAGVAAVNAAAWFVCTRGNPRAGFDTNRRLQTVAFACNMASWVLRTMVHYRWSQGAGVSLAVERACSSVYIYISETFVCTVEQVYALMFLPSALVAALLALHLRIVYGAVKHVQVEPSVISTTIWVLAELLLPHAVHYYMLKTVQRRDGVLGPAGHSPAAGSVARASAEVATEQAASCAKVPPELCGQVGPSSSSPGKEAAAVSTRQTAQAPDENLVAAETTAEAGHGLVSAAQDTGSGHAMLPSEAGVTVDDDSKGLLQQLSTSIGVPPTQGVLQALENAKAMARASSRQLYRSRLVQPQTCIIKLLDTEPDQLRQDIISAINEAMNQGRAGMVIARACVRRGCTLLLLDLLQLPSGQDQPHRSAAEDLPIQALLQSLLSPGTPISDGAVAHITLGSRNYQASWQQQEGTWEVEEAASDTTAASLHCSLMYVHSSVARLLHQSSSAGVRNNVHRVSLLMETSQALLFTGSDQFSAPPEQPADSRQVPVQCVARGCWGTCLPVAVAGVEVQEMEGRGATKSSLTALTLDVDLNEALHPGSVQLELWCGRALLASAPLLLLPSSSNVPEGPQERDPLFEELQTYSASVIDASALLTDLGQVLYSLECVQQYTARLSGYEQDVNSSGPSSSWGGIVAGLAAQHACDLTTLSSMHELASGLLEYAKSEGLKHTAALLVSGIMRLHQRLGAVKGAVTEATSALRSGTAVKGQSPAGPSNMEAVPGAKSAAAVVTGPAGATSAQQSTSSSLRFAATEAGLVHRKPGHPVAQTAAGKSAAGAGWTSHKQSSGNGQAAGQPPALQPAAPHATSRMGVVRECLRHAVLGFRPRGVEQAYKQWVAKRWRSFVRTHSMLLSFWVLASMLRSLSDGWQTWVTHLPAHLWAVSPWFTSMVACMFKQDRWQELLLVFHTIGRTNSSAGGALGLHTMPFTFSTTCKLGMHVWGELLFFPLAEPMRFPALLVSHLYLVIYDVAMIHICGCQGSTCIPQTVAVRLCAFALGLARDMARRHTFMREQQALLKQE